MIIKQISNNPAINADRFAVCNLTVSPDEVVIYGHTEYRDANGDVVPDTLKKQFSFNTTGNMVDMNGDPAVMIHTPILDGDGNPTGETDPEWPAGTIPEIAFLQNIPANAFPDATLWGRIERLVSMRVDRLDQQGKFN